MPRVDNINAQEKTMEVENEVDEEEDMFNFEENDKNDARFQTERVKGADSGGQNEDSSGFFRFGRRKSRIIDSNLSDRENQIMEKEEVEEEEVEGQNTQERSSFMQSKYDLLKKQKEEKDLQRQQTQN